MYRKMLIAFGVIAILLLPLMGGGDRAVSGYARIPAAVWDAMDDSTRRELTEEPKYIALTFDDGPRRGTTDVLLDGLLERGAAATFFVIGQQIPGNEDLICRMAAEGHQVGNHTYTHMRLLGAQPDVVQQEIGKTRVLLESILGEGERWLRPPYGLIDSAGAKVVDTPMIYWTLDPEDWKLLDAQQVTQAVLERVRPGDVILLHDFYPTTVEAALTLVDRLGEEGYSFVIVEELFRIRGEAPVAGALYAAPGQVRSVQP